jgi:hypothetical protein
MHNINQHIHLYHRSGQIAFAYITGSTTKVYVSACIANDLSHQIRSDFHNDRGVLGLHCHRDGLTICLSKFCIRFYFRSCVIVNIQPWEHRLCCVGHIHF